MTRQKGRPKTYNSSLNVRVHSKTSALIQAIASYEGLEVADIVRMWLTQKKTEYLRNKRFTDWLGRSREDLRAKGVIVDLLFDGEAKTSTNQAMIAA